MKSHIYYPGVLIFNYFIFILFFWPHHAACGILVPQSEVEPMLPALKV